MPEILEKLRPDRDLQSYFFRPSAIAALSASTPTGFTLSGTWRQQFDWAVVEWNRDNVFEHPLFRNLPDGDLSGLTLTYEETRSNCIPMDSDLFPTVDWPSLRIWASDGEDEQIYYVNLKDYAVPIEGTYQPASTVIELGGTETVGDYVGFAFLDEHYSYVMTANPIWFAAQNLVDGVNSFSPTMTASRNGNQIALSFLGTAAGGISRASLSNSTTGANGNRAGLYTYVYSPAEPSETWDTSWKQFSGGGSPTRWRITLPLGSLVDVDGNAIPMHLVRKLRWTYAAELQRGAFDRSEFEVIVSNWQVTGTGRTYSVSGPGSQRINDDAATVQYTGRQWVSAKGNFSHGTIHQTSTPGASLQVTYSAAQSHSLYMGTRFASNGTLVQVVLDGGSPFTLNLALPLEDVLIRSSLGRLGPGSHTIKVTHVGQLGTYFYFDFLEVSIPTTALPVNPIEPRLTLATDWDTDHSIALAPERTAWFLQSLGFKGRVNHYAGALWFYELVRAGHQYASGNITFTGAPDANLFTQIFIGRTDQPVSKNVPIAHQNLVGDTAVSLAKAFELKINNGYTAIWAQAEGAQLTIFSRAMGSDGNAVTIDVTPPTAHLTTSRSGATLTGGEDGNWRTDLTAVPRVNRAARDWTGSFCTAVKSGGVEVTVAFSMELQHGDPSLAAGIAQRYPSGQAVILDTPALQTNFSPASQSFWKQVYLDMAQVQAVAGLRPYLQFGEVQWWYNMDGDHSGMPFYDAYTLDTFRSLHGSDMAVITSHDVDPATVSAEAAFLPTLIGAFTNSIIAFVRASLLDCRFEVLYPTDVNSPALNKVINYPVSDWTPGALDCLKTESFTYTFTRNLDLAMGTINAGVAWGFPSAKRSHLVGIEDSATAWAKEARMAEAKRFDSVVLFALDQFCLMGYGVPISRGLRRAVQLG